MRKMKVTEIAALGAALIATLPRLARLPRLHPEQMCRWQLRRLQRLVRHAYQNVAFYRRRYDEAGVCPDDLQSLADLQRFPVVTKDEVVANYPAQIIARGYRLESLIVSRSSGSSGKVLDIAYDTRAFLTFIAAGLRLYRMGFEYRPWHRQLYVYTSPYPLNSLGGLYPLKFVSTLAPIADVVAEIQRSRPALLVCYPSHLRQIAAALRAAERRGLSLKAVSVNSEMSTQAERDDLAGQLGCPVLDEYSSEELTRIAAQCRSKHYHLFEDINYIEVLDDRGEPTDAIGTIVGTNLHNFAMPMIRYQQNDLGRVVAEHCPCGWRFRQLRDLQGRHNDSFILPSGRVLTSGFLLDATYEFLLAHRGAVRDFCLIQEAPASIRLEIVPGSAWNSAVSRAIAARFGEFLEPEVKLIVASVTECRKTRSGKRNPIISLVDHSPAAAP